MNESHEHNITLHEHGITRSGGDGPNPLSGGYGQTVPPITPEEWDQYGKSDRGAGRAVVMLMASIFTIGLALYAVVAYVCWFKVM
jgi:hypothetical protein